MRKAIKSCFQHNLPRSKKTDYLQISSSTYSAAEALPLSCRKMKAFGLAGKLSKARLKPDETKSNQTMFNIRTCYISSAIFSGWNAMESQLRNCSYFLCFARKIRNEGLQAVSNRSSPFFFSFTLIHVMIHLKRTLKVLRNPPYPVQINDQVQCHSL